MSNDLEIGEWHISFLTDTCAGKSKQVNPKKTKCDQKQKIQFDQGRAKVFLSVAFQKNIRGQKNCRIPYAINVYVKEKASKDVLSTSHGRGLQQNCSVTTPIKETIHVLQTSRSQQTYLMFPFTRLYKLTGGGSKSISCTTTEFNMKLVSAKTKEISINPTPQRI